ncbi:glycosyltransferase family 4 protein [Sphingomonas sp. CFBP 13728]|uniref:glycosyltransferase family 4 protein n=1 Tax=Sphingomonas sp. CFBP 13728 TaxID=2775294 RepID=UPI001781153D|nr:glycosyltransferase family 4 protein [Sphingomonas sp. CFBP 13728]MBD8620709.1 glycosyltransferase family 4 protein [Sphingomonas sp. CFBP 13728]
MVDPSLFTAPYDAALSDGLQASGTQPTWATRALRANEEDLLAMTSCLPFFYPFTDGPRRRTGSGWRAVKGLEHVAGLRRLRKEAARFDLVHFQWAPLPMLDVRAVRRIRRDRPVVLTVHDVEPFNGRPVSAAQSGGYHAMLGQFDRLIVHTEQGRDALRTRGLPADRIRVIPHGVLPLRAAAPEPRADDGRWRIVLFGRLQAYKGVDLLVEALGLIDPAVRARIEVIVAGEAQMPVEPILARAADLNLGASFTLRAGRLSEDAMAALLRSSDAFVFPYRAIDASGVLHLVADLHRWLIASDIGAFRTMIGKSDDTGDLVAPADTQALADAIVRSIGRRPQAPPDTGVSDWTQIGAMTRDVYEAALADRGRSAAS